MLERRIDGKFVRSFLDIIVMAVCNSRPTYGYEIIASVHREFGVLLSPGTLYPLLHSLEDEGLIESSNDGGRIVYQVSSRGKQKFKSTLITFGLAVEKMSNFIKERTEKIVLPV